MVEEEEKYLYSPCQTDIGKHFSLIPNLIGLILSRRMRPYNQVPVSFLSNGRVAPLSKLPILAMATV